MRAALPVFFILISVLSPPAHAASQQLWRQCLQQDNPDTAIRTCTSILNAGKETRQNQALALGGRCTAYRLKGNPDLAIDDCTESIRLNPKSNYAYVDRGIVLAAKGDFDRAIDDYSKAIELNPRDKYAFNARGWAYYRKREHDRAIDDFSVSLRIDRQYANAYLGRANAYSGKGDEDRAIADYGEAIRLDPRDVYPLANRCGSYLKQRKLDLALADCDRALQLDPNNMYAHYNRAAIYNQQGSSGLADDHYRAILALSPEGEDEVELQNLVRRNLEGRGTAAATASQVDLAEAAPYTGPVLPRVALVIGNSRYETGAALTTAQNDARVVASSLRRLGFRTVTIASDLNADAMRRALVEFGAEASRAEWAVVYFSGHGLELGGENFLVPIDAQLKSDRDVALEAISLDQVLASVQGAKKLRIVILDACRENPFISRMTKTLASRSIGRGLARVEPEGATLVAYSAKGGQIAVDGGGPYSPFAAALARYLEVPGVEINHLFRLVREEVLAATGKRQQPFVYGSLPSEEFYFNSK